MISNKSTQVSFTGQSFLALKKYFCKVLAGTNKGKMTWSDNANFSVRLFAGKD